MQIEGNLTRLSGTPAINEIDREVSSLRKFAAPSFSEPSVLLLHNVCAGDKIDLAQSNEYTDYLRILPVFRKLLMGGVPPDFVAESPAQHARNTMLEILVRLPLNDISRPHVVGLAQVLLHVLITDNEENGLLAAKHLFSLHKFMRHNSNDMKAEAAALLRFLHDAYTRATTAVTEYLNDGVDAVRLSEAAAAAAAPGKPLSAVASDALAALARGDIPVLSPPADPAPPPAPAPQPSPPTSSGAAAAASATAVPAAEEAAAAGADQSATQAPAASAAGASNPAPAPSVMPPLLPVPPPLNADGVLSDTALVPAAWSFRVLTEYPIAIILLNQLYPASDLASSYIGTVVTRAFSLLRMFSLPDLRSLAAGDLPSTASVQPSHAGMLSQHQQHQPPVRRPAAAAPAPATAPSTGGAPMEVDGEGVPGSRNRPAALSISVSTAAPAAAPLTPAQLLTRARVRARLNHELLTAVMKVMTLAAYFLRNMTPFTQALVKPHEEAIAKTVITLVCALCNGIASSSSLFLLIQLGRCAYDQPNTRREILITARQV
jgi:hypothetical protein